MVVLLSKGNANTVKKCAHAHFWLFYALRGFYPKEIFDALRGPSSKEIVSSTTQDILHHMSEGVLTTYPN
jgi:hypothetical protein